MAVLSILAAADTLGMRLCSGDDEDQPSAMRLLAAGVPLSLLLDLACPGGPDSEGIAAAERMANR